VPVAPRSGAAPAAAAYGRTHGARPAAPAAAAGCGERAKGESAVKPYLQVKHTGPRQRHRAARTKLDGSDAHANFS
jgi:hypothetical protein